MSTDEPPTKKRRTGTRTFVAKFFRYNERGDGLGTFEQTFQQWANRRCKKCYYGRETCPKTGKPYLQCFFTTKNALVFESLKEQLRECYPHGVRPEVHVEERRKSEWANKKYCGNEVQVWELGHDTRQGERTDLNKAIELLQELTTWREVVAHPDLQQVLFKNFDWVRMQWYRICGERILEYERNQPWEPREWQQQVLDTIEREPDEQKIIFIVDSRGNTGKTFLAEKLEAIRDDVETWNTFPRPKNLAYALEGKRVQVFDVPRSANINYNLLKNLKNGCIFSPKYRSVKKRFPTPHVFVFCTTPPDLTKLSRHKLKIFTVQEDMSLAEMSVE